MWDWSVDAVRDTDGQVWRRGGPGGLRWVADDTGIERTGGELAATVAGPVSDVPVGAPGPLPSGRATGCVQAGLDGSWTAIGREDGGGVWLGSCETFAEAEHALVDWDQRTHADRFGDVSHLARGGAETPWGPVASMSEPAPGIAVVETQARGGGTYLSPERNQGIPAPLRSDSGWYAERFEGFIPAAYYPQMSPDAGRRTREAIRASMLAGVKNWFPAQYEEAIGCTIPFGVSVARDEADWWRRHADREVGTTARYHGDVDGVPHMAVTVRRGGRDGSGPARTILVPEDEYRARLSMSRPKHGAYAPVEFVVAESRRLCRSASRTHSPVNLNSTPKRHPRGTRAGGRFAAGSRGEAPEYDFETVSVPTHQPSGHPGMLTDATLTVVRTDDGRTWRRAAPFGDEPVWEEVPGSGLWMYEEDLAAAGITAVTDVDGEVAFDPDRSEWVASSPDGEVVSRQATFAAAEHDLASWGQRTIPERYGDVTHVRDGSRTPWGAAQIVTHIAPGLASVSTAGHGGVKLSKERNLSIPKPLRRDSGWYEEDGEAYIALAYHPEGAAHAGRRSREQIRAEMTAGVKDWFPDEYERATGEVIPFGVSHQKDRADWEARHRDVEVATSARYHDPDPGLLEVSVRRGSDGSSRVILVPRADYDAPKPRHGAYQSISFVVDPARTYRDITPPPPPPPPAKPRYRGVNTDFDAMTPAAADLVRKDLRRRWRDDDGTVKTLQQRLEDGHITAKTVMVQNGRRTYWLRGAGGPANEASHFALPVSKATWDAVEAPDDRTPRQVAGQDYEIALNRLGRDRHADPDTRKRAEAAFVAARDRRDALAGHTG